MKFKSKQKVQDATVIGTNSYSIVSKRSVEKLYYADEPAFLRAFVSKFKRRAPLINRGYWLRMKAIEEVVKQFLAGDKELGYPKAADWLPSRRYGSPPRRRVVVNLGCGEDTLPFRTLWQRKEALHEPGQGPETKVLFVDVDYPELMARKRNVIVNTPLLRDAIDFGVSDDALRGSIDPMEPGVLLQTPSYAAVGANLSDLSVLSSLFHQVLDDGQGGSLIGTELEILFIAEVSITYMPTHASNAVIQWARNLFPQASSHFCLLEQILPAGTDHPFAETMLKHFEKSAPLQSVTTYPALVHQQTRFKQAGWDRIKVRTLWDVWQESTFVNHEERVELDKSEPFDEWEELALFAGHYVFLLASSERKPSLIPTSNGHIDLNGDNIGSELFQLSAKSSMMPPRRFAAGASFDGVVANIAGFNSTNICRNNERIANSVDANAAQVIVPDVPEPLACHAVTKLGNGHYLLTGGRASPSKASACSWLLTDGKRVFEDAPRESFKQWHSAAPLEPGRFRHCAARIGRNDQEGVLVFGGKASSGDVLDDWKFWRASTDSWSSAKVSYKRPSARFGAVLAVTNAVDTNSSGWLFGGLDGRGLILDDFWQWSACIDCDGFEGIQLHFTECSARLRGHKELVSRFGAAAVLAPFEVGIANLSSSNTGAAGLLLIGGIGQKGVFQLNEEIVLISEDLVVHKVDIPDWKPSRPLLVGHSIIGLEEQVAILGGGAVCFSFGAYWNARIEVLSSAYGTSSQPTAWSLLKGPTSFPSAAANDTDRINIVAKDISSSTARVQSAPVPPVSQWTTVDSTIFSDLCSSPAPQPVLFPAQDIGSCTSLWSPYYLIEAIGADRPVTIHTSTTPALNFTTKNFTYTTVPFSSLITSAVTGSHVYLRSLASNQPARQPANLSSDFPNLATDFILPPPMAAVLTPQRTHSSVLRIAGDIAMWLHYDTQANVLCQVRGRKRVVLFPPSDVSKLGFAAGSTTSDADVFGPDGLLAHWRERGLQPQEVTLARGDVLFIPACWLHATAPGEEETEADDGAMNVAVNVFFRSLEKGYAAGRDVYGNRDLEAYQNGRQDVERIRTLLRNDDARGGTLVLGRIVRGDKDIRIEDKAVAGREQAEAIRKKLEALPDQLREFYAQRLADEIDAISRERS